MPDDNRTDMISCAGCKLAHAGGHEVTPEIRKLIRSVALVFGLGLTSLFCLVFALTEVALTNLESLLVVLGVCLSPIAIIAAKRGGMQATQPSLEFEDP